ncbi:MAG: hypothetical protein WAW13_01630 [Minisyncoccia bacterium]
MDNQELKQLFQWYESINWNRLNRTELGQSGSLNGAQLAIQRIKTFFDFLINQIKDELVSSEVKQDIAPWLQKFQVIHDESVKFTDVRLRDDVIKKIKDFEYKLMNDLGGVVPYLELINKVQESAAPKAEIDTSLIASEIEKKLSTKLSHINKIDEAVVLNLIQNNDVINEAIETAKSWIASSNEIEDRVLARNANSAIKKALEHKTFFVTTVESPFIRITKIWGINQVFNFLFLLLPFLKRIFVTQPSFHGTFKWLIGSIIFASSAFFMIGYFIYLNESVSIGNSLLRISAIIIPLYFSILFAQQYLNHRKLYESYMFKDIALQSMIDLRSRFNNSNDAPKILDKALSVIFTEPVLDNNIKFDKLLFKEVLDLVKKNNS